MKISKGKLQAIKLELETMGHPDPIALMARGLLLSNLNNKNYKDKIGWLRLPVDVYDEMLVPPVNDDVDTVTLIGASKDITMYQDQGMTLEQIDSYWVGNKSLEDAKEKIYSLLDEGEENDANIQDTFETLVNNDVDKPTNPQALNTDVRSQFLLALIQKLNR